jgi:hypothetical protein
VERPPWVIVLALMLPLPVLAAGTSAAADALGSRSGRALSVATRGVLRPSPAAGSPVFVEALVAPESSAGDAWASGTMRPAPARREAASARIPKKGVRVRAEVVLRLVNSGARPSGFPVPAQGDRPRGLALSGVSGLGIGLEDGDILTHAAGRPALTPADVVGVVIGSRVEHAPEIWGRFWRNGEPWNLVVEQPYVKVRRKAEGS